MRFTHTVLAGAFLLLTSITAQAIEIKTVESAGGIKAWHVEDHTLPIISMSFAFKGGSIQDPAGKEAASRLMTALLDEGAGDMEAAAFQDRAEDLAVNLSFSAGRDTYFGSVRMLRANAEESFELLQLALNAPRFDEQPFNRIRDQLSEQVTAQVNNPSHRAGEAMRAMIYPEDHPYRTNTGGTAESVAAITRDDLSALKDRVFARDNLVVSVVGAISEEELKARLDQIFGALPEKADLRDFKEIQPNLGGEDAIAVARPQVALSVIGQGIDREDPDFIAAVIVNYILGGSGLTSRLSDEIREKRGLAYSVSSSLSNNDLTNLFTASVATRADFAGETFEILMREFDRMGREGPTEEELELAKSFLIGAYALNFDGSRGTASTLLQMQLQGREPDYIQKRKGLIEAVTLDDARRVAARLFKDAEFAIVRVGPVEATDSAGVNSGG
ncbi:MAG: pitrilysin family protein [Pseudomonadota bacterium]